MDEKMDEIYSKCWQQMLFCGKLNKRNKVETIYDIPLMISLYSFK
jgi:hypothetical protein